MIRIVTDSTCDLPAGQLAQLGVTVVPISISFDSEEYLEGETLAYGEFFRKIEETGVIPKTSQPAPGRFIQTYRQLAAAGATTVLSLHVTGKLSGTAQSAKLAAETLANEVDVRVFDSLGGSAGNGFMVLEAHEMLAQGANADQILARWSEMREQLQIFFYLDTLKYARMSGRVGALQGALASVLKIKPLIVLDHGVLNVAERVRSRKAALARLMEMIEEQTKGQPINLAVIHAEDLAGAQELLASLQARLDCRRTFIARLATSLVTNLGIGTLGTVFYPIGSRS